MTYIYQTYTRKIYQTCKRNKGIQTQHYRSHQHTREEGKRIIKKELQNQPENNKTAVTTVNP